ncbi:MAG: DegV family protein [Lachnospiraceae bacterium]|nr:DegV family protein [Lachnospiraceae bacterium]
MEEFRIVTDTNTDLPEAYAREHDLSMMFFPYTLDGVTYNEETDMDYKEFYEAMRAGKMPSTSQINPLEARNYLEQYVKTCRNILCLSFSSGLSGSYNNIRMAAEELMEEQDCNIIVIDSLAASMGEGLFVHKAVKMKEAGKSMEEIANYLEIHRQNFAHVFTVDDLNHLYRGGRVSKTTAILGTMANIKPILHVDSEGHLIPMSKVRGRKKSLHSLVDYMEEKMGSYLEENKQDMVFISHGDAIEDAKLVAEDIKARFGIESFLINHIGPTIGTHSGPGTIALFFMGESR